MANVVQGLTDEAAERDLFEIQKYIDGLTSFIESCNTPMTISIQGSWGTGKTSIMQIINQTLTEKKEPKTHNIWFNTWQFSQFNMDDDLAISLLSCLLDELSASEKEKEATSKLIRGIRMAGRLGKELVFTAVDSKIGGRLAENVENLWNDLTSNQNDPASIIKNLKNEFSKRVKTTLDRTGKDRVVVFIDDLDRLEPRKAVELLEVLKLFLDCQNCVFVLAIDYAVVCRGVEAKYGKLSDDKVESAEKGRSFFDKIIQVPFKMPVAEYNINNYVKECFKQIHVECPEDEVAIYVDLIKSSIGVNPRSMKRLFNAYLLLSIVISDDILSSDKNKQLLFGILCLQHSFENLYNIIVEQRNSLQYDLLEKLATVDNSTAKDVMEYLNNKMLTETELLSAQPFMDKLLDQVIDIDHDGNISEQEMEHLKNVLGISTMTSASESTTSARMSNEVKTIQELLLTDVQQAATEEILNEIKTIGENVTFSIRNNKNRHIIIKNGTGKTIGDIFFRKNNFACDCYTGSITKKTAEINRIVKKYTGTTELGYYTTLSVKFGDEESKNDFLTILKACYESRV